MTIKEFANYLQGLPEKFQNLPFCLYNDTVAGTGEVLFDPAQGIYFAPGLVGGDTVPEVVAAPVIMSNTNDELEKALAETEKFVAGHKERADLVQKELKLPVPELKIEFKMTQEFKPAAEDNKDPFGHPQIEETTVCENVKENRPATVGEFIRHLATAPVENQNSYTNSMFLRYVNDKGLQVGFSTPFQPVDHPERALHFLWTHKDDPIIKVEKTTYFPDVNPRHTYIIEIKAPEEQNGTAV